VAQSLRALTIREQGVEGFQQRGQVTGNAGTQQALQRRLSLQTRQKVVQAGGKCQAVPPLLSVTVAGASVRSRVSRAQRCGGRQFGQEQAGIAPQNGRPAAPGLTRLVHKGQTLGKIQAQGQALSQGPLVGAQALAVGSAGLTLLLSGAAAAEVLHQRASTAWLAWSR